MLFAAIILGIATWFFTSDLERSPGGLNIPSGGFISSETGSVFVYHLNVGQGDNELIRLPIGGNILVSVSLSKGADQLTTYLKQLSVRKTSYLIATCPHAGHIDGMVKAISNLKIGKTYAPKVVDSQVPTMCVYENMFDAVEEGDLRLMQGRTGITVLEQGNIRFEFLVSVEGEYSDLNNYSIVTKLTFGQCTFLFIGDAEKESEQQMLKKYADSLRSDVLKVCHHGGNGSSSAGSLKAVTPKYAIISCGEDNDYDRPNEGMLTRFADASAEIYRTDGQGTILMSSDGIDLTIKTELPLLAASQEICLIGKNLC